MILTSFQSPICNDSERPRNKEPLHQGINESIGLGNNDWRNNELTHQLEKNIWTDSTLN